MVLNFIYMNRATRFNIWYKEYNNSIEKSLIILNTHLIISFILHVFAKYLWYSQNSHIGLF